MGSLDKSNEELRTVGVAASVGHGQQVGLVVPLDEILILELLAVDGASTGSVSTGEVTTLGHEAGDDTVELGLDVALADLLVQAKITEVLSGLGDNIVVELELDTAPVVLVAGSVGPDDVKEGVGHCIGS